MKTHLITTILLSLAPQLLYAKYIEECHTNEACIYYPVILQQKNSEPLTREKAPEVDSMLKLNDIRPDSGSLALLSEQDSSANKTISVNSKRSLSQKVHDVYFFYTRNYQAPFLSKSGPILPSSKK